MDIDPQRLRANLDDVRRRIDQAARRAGRTGDDVRLVAVTKTVDVDTIRGLLDAGQEDIGENRARQLRDRAAALEGAPVRWHMIGHLQRNKVKYCAGLCAMIHSVDSVRLAREIDKRSEDEPVACLLEVNVSGEEAKHGLAPEAASEAAGEIAARPGVDLRGLMAMAPLAADPELSRPVFARLRELKDEINIERNLPRPLEELSMGMTQDFEVAVEEGATIVRIGSALFA